MDVRPDVRNFRHNQVISWDELPTDFIERFCGVLLRSALLID